MSRVAPLFCLMAVVASAAGGCDGGPSREQLQKAAEVVKRVKSSLDSQAAETSSLPPVQAGDTIRVASFNIQVFGTSKSSKPDVMEVLADIVRRFDVVAIQELRTIDESVMGNFVQLINQTGRTYQCVVGPRLGRTVSKEQYVFVYDASRVELIPGTVVTLDDPEDLLHREPTLALFRTRSNGPSPPFSFLLVNSHTDPDETDQELDALADAFEAAQQNPWREDDVILLGDLNVDYLHFGRLGQLPEITCTVRGEMTNTRGTKAYDNIVFNRAATTEFTGNAGVLHLVEDLGLTMEKALEVSDHNPIWAEFRAAENPGNALLANRDAGAVNRPATPPPGAAPSPGTRR